MLRSFTIFLIGCVAGTGLGGALSYLLFPAIVAPPPVSERPALVREAPVLARGTFIQADPAKPRLHGRGGVVWRESGLHLDADFSVGPGPKYHVYLVPTPTVRAAADVIGSMFVDLGELRAFRGSQSYEVPTGLEPRRYPSVVIWSEHLSAVVSPADLMFE